jgi:hypothetical protein
VTPAIATTRGLESPTCLDKLGHFGLILKTCGWAVRSRPVVEPPGTPAALKAFQSLARTENAGVLRTASRERILAQAR